MILEGVGIFLGFCLAAGVAGLIVGGIIELVGAAVATIRWEFKSPAARAEELKQKEDARERQNYG